MPDDTKDMKKDQGQNPGQSGQQPEQPQQKQVILQKKILLRIVIKSRTTCRSSTRAASVALPRVHPSPGQDWRDPYFRRTSSKLNLPDVPSDVIERLHRADFDVASKILLGSTKDVSCQNQCCCSQDISNDSKPTFGSGPSFYAFAFILVALREEFRARGYGLFQSLSRHRLPASRNSLGSVFGYSHHGNSGEDWIV